MNHTLVSLLSLSLMAQDPLDTARRALREGRLEEARNGFDQRLSKVPQDTDALVGAGFTALRQDRALDARAHFLKAIALAPRYADAHFGLALALERFGKVADAKGALQKALDLEPDRPDFAEAKARLLPPPPPPVPAVTRPATLLMNYRISKAKGFEMRTAQGWQAFFAKGINLGAALPGKYPSEFPAKPVYVQWLKEMADVGFNVLRVYTIHPPHFYEALREHNLQAKKPILLIHGVWTEPPPDDEFTHPDWFGAWKDEMVRVVDLLHGRSNLPARPGHASGVYRADVSPWTLAYILGREWEPDNVVAFNSRHPGERDFQGRFVRGRSLHATEHFMAEAMEYLLAYEHDVYHVQRPMAYTNWPTLDPLTHPTEATKAEEAVLRKRLGLPYEPGQKVNEYDNDALGLDMEKYSDGPESRAGFFASYHAYPYYPDFMNLDPEYMKGRDSQGPNNYLAYLKHLVAHHRTHAVVISEFGVPSSRLVAHWQAQGMTHGGQTEREQGAHNARLFKNIWESGCAGGALFAWIDEWFKKNWLVIDFQEPLERKPYWYNVQDAEQNYGLLGYHPGAEGPTVLIDGKSKDWEAIPVYAQGEGYTLKAVADEGWFHVAVSWNAAALPGDRQALMIGFDTLDPKLGSHRLPFGLPLKSEAGLEFVAVFQGNRAAVYADEPYDLFTHRFSRPYRTVANDLGRFVMPRTESNRLRVGRDGTVFPEHRQEIGWLRRGTQDRTEAAFDSRAEWCTGPGFLEARIPWGLLNVSDPSSRCVVQDGPAQRQDAVGTATTEGFRMMLVAYEAQEFQAQGRVLATLPAANNGILKTPPLFTWKPWDIPTFHRFKKQSYDLVREALMALPDAPQPLR